MGWPQADSEGSRTLDLIEVLPSLQWKDRLRNQTKLRDDFQFRTPTGCGLDLRNEVSRKLESLPSKLYQLIWKQVGLRDFEHSSVYYIETEFKRSCEVLYMQQGELDISIIENDYFGKKLIKRIRKLEKYKKFEEHQIVILSEILDFKWAEKL